jgi:ribonuclease P protein component
LRRAAGRGATNSRASRIPRARDRGRLTHRAEFDAVYRNGRRRSSRQFTVFFAPNGLEECRLGMSVGRALCGAGVRNRIRRRVREIVRLNRGEIPTGWDIVVHPRASVAKAGFAPLRDELLSLLRNSIPASPVSSIGEQAPNSSRGNSEPGAPRGTEPAS